MKPLVADFFTRFTASKSIETRQLQPFIQDARLLDMEPALGYELLEAVENLPAFTVREATDIELPSVLLNDLVRRRDHVFRALVDAPLLAPPTEPVTTELWAYESLITLAYSFALPYWQHAAYARFLSDFGINVVKGGLTVPTDPGGTFMPASPAQRAQLLASAESKTEAMLARLMRFLPTYKTESTCGPASRVYRRRFRSI
ncbi:tyrosinase family protein [Hymenobacter sp. BT18]|uniref:tyrosinase family protein n=1 Tax=Hymenobacter sp. BT18 TaxID=2835648 RepID=UPI00143E7615|nr:tyrosinase family protein [Hymenobacter sp. BT18]QIX61864.1 tyrosinase family protein [Hymenobacter sp. BT18]